MENTYPEPSSYADAVGQLNALTERLERESINLEDIDAILQQADYLIRYCRGRLHDTKESIDSTIARWDDTASAPQSED